jgi:hypothetical protein
MQGLNFHNANSILMVKQQNAENGGIPKRDRYIRGLKMVFKG